MIETLDYNSIVHKFNIKHRAMSESIPSIHLQTSKFAG